MNCSRIEDISSIELEESSNIPTSQNNLSNNKYNEMVMIPLSQQNADMEFCRFEQSNNLSLCQENECEVQQDDEEELLNPRLSHNHHLTSDHPDEPDYYVEIRLLKLQLWEMQNNQIYSQKNGLSKSIFSKLKTMKIGNTSKDCSVCFSSFHTGELIKRLPCKHIFHTNCIKPWLKKSVHCPVCRLDLKEFFQNKNTSTLPLKINTTNSIQIAKTLSMMTNNNNTNIPNLTNNISLSNNI